MSKRAELISIVTSKKNKEIQDIFTKIRSDTITLKRDTITDPFKQSQKIESILKSHNSKLFFTITDKTAKSEDTIVSTKYFTIGRSFNYEIIDMLKFKILKFIKSFENVIPAECNMKYFIILQNIDDERVESLFIDILNMKSTKICLENIKYTWIVSNLGNDMYVLKYCRILTNGDMEDIGPYYEMELVDKYHCSEELYKKSIGETNKKKTKNIEKNEFKDVIGKLHIEKQDLREIKLRKYRN